MPRMRSPRAGVRGADTQPAATRASAGTASAHLIPTTILARLYPSQPAHPRKHQGRRRRERGQREPADREGGAHAEQRGQRANLQLTERREPDRHDPGPARASAEGRRDAELQEALRQEISEGAAPSPTRLAPKTAMTSRNSAPPPGGAPRATAATRPRMPPIDRAALSTPSPSGPTRSTSRARLGSRTWCANPKISAPAVSAMSTSSARSVLTAAKNSKTLRHSEPAGGSDSARSGAGAPSRAAAPAR